MLRILSLATLLGFGVGWPSGLGRGPTLIAAETPPGMESNSRRYEDGPLQADDFQAEPAVKQEGDLRLLASTVTQLAYDYRYRFERRGKRTTVRLTSVRVYALVRRDQSWNSKKQDAALLDHEQGHFDIAEIHARLAQIELLTRFKTEGRPVVTAATKAAAVQGLEKKLSEVVNVFSETSHGVDEEYDRSTRHGTRGESQAAQRKQQLAQLKSLAEELAKLETP